MRSSLVIAAAASSLLSLLHGVAQAQSSASCGPAPSHGVRPSLASGYRMQVVATGLSKPRGIVLDSAGNLLVVEQGRGVISAHSLNEENGCVTINSSSDVTSPLQLNHGIDISTDGRTLYASTSDELYSWAYDPAARSISRQTTHVTNMGGSGHSTRTILLSRLVPGMVVVSRGSAGNLDFQTANVESGVSQVKAFNLTNATRAYDYANDGLLLGWGLRNSVGVAEHPVTGGINTVENSADQISRFGVDVHEDNPAEEMNFLGYLDGTESPNSGRNFGYPWCFSAWEAEDLPENEDLRVGSQFAIDASPSLNNENRTDEYCADQQAARLVFQAHTAPLDIKFNDSGREAWITFHGSWNRDDPIGYNLAVVPFNENGEPEDDSQSMTAARSVLANEDNSICPGSCLRPVGMAFDSQGRLFMTSDSSGEIYLVSRSDDFGGMPSPSGTEPESPTPSGSASSLIHSLPVGDAYAPFALAAYLLCWLAIMT